MICLTYVPVQRYPPTSFLSALKSSCTLKHFSTQCNSVSNYCLWQTNIHARARLCRLLLDISVKVNYTSLLRLVQLPVTIPH